jgi:hypothetical protein
MIPLPPFLAAIPAERLAKIVFGLGFALCFFLIGMGVHKTFSDRKIARLEKAQAEARAELNAQIAEAEQHARKVEAQWAADIRRVETEYFAALRQRDSIVRDLAVAGDGLRNRLDSLQQQAAAGSTSTCRDVHKRVEALVLLLREVDDLAEESGRAADDLGSELALCRSYAQTVSKQD